MADEAWDGGWDAHARRQRASWAATTPQQRLAWLEEAIEFVRHARRHRLDGNTQRLVETAGSIWPRQDHDG